MIRYGNIEVPRAAVAQLASRLGRNGKSTHYLSVQLGWAIDNNRESFNIPRENVDDVLQLLAHDGIAGLEPLADVLRQQITSS
jgi:hypothetical protein